MSEFEKKQNIILISLAAILIVLLITGGFVIGFVEHSEAQRPVIESELAEASISNKLVTSAAADYYYITFNVESSTNKLAVVKGATVDFTQVGTTYKYNGTVYNIEGWTTEEVIYPWQASYVKGYKYSAINQDNFIPTGDITLNAIITDTSIVTLPEGEDPSVRLSGWDMFKINIVNWFTSTQAGSTLLQLLTIVGWVIVGLLCLVAFVIICYFVAKGIKMFRN